MAKAVKNYYAVRKGHHPGIYKTWDECQEQVSGFSGAEFKGFETFKDAMQFMAGENGKIGYEDGGKTEEENLLVEFQVGHFFVAFLGDSWSVCGSAGDYWFTARWNQTSNTAQCWHQQKGDMTLSVAQVRAVIKKYA